MDTSGFLPQLGNDDPLFEVAEYTQIMKAKLAPTPVAPAFLNGWTQFGGGYQLLVFMKVGQIVFVTGMIKPGTVTSGTSVATIPAGMIPPSQNNQIIGTQSSGSPTYQATSLVQFSSDGTVKLFNLPTGTGYVMFNNFYVAAS